MKNFHFMCIALGIFPKRLAKNNFFNNNLIILRPFENLVKLQLEISKKHVCKIRV